MGDVHVRVAVVGAGFAGLGMAVRLAQEGIDDFLVFERGDDVGGTWRDNTYPGCSCDVPSNLYSFSFAPNPDWSSSFGQQPEIHRYLTDCVDRFGLQPHLRLRHDMLDARWDDTAGRWVLETSRGTVTATVLVCGTGSLSEPSIPAVPGLADFEGAAFHSARWDHSLDLRGARVAVIGTGASAVQFVPEIAPDVAALHLFQRTPPWIMPRVDHTRRPLENRLFRAFPAVQRWLRAASYWGRESTLVALARPRLMRVAEVLARVHLRRQVGDPELRAALTPDYTLGCKRVIVSSAFYPALQRPNVELVASPLREVRARSVVAADGTERDVDTIVFGTGFRAADPAVARRLHGRGGRRLASEWAGGAQAYLGTAVAGFPNLFLLVGPNSGPGHNSTLLTIESQVGYVLDALRVMAERDLATVEVRPQAQSAFVADVQQRMAGMVWTTGGCTSWYLDGSGRNTTLWPGSIRRFRRLTRRFDPESYVLRPALLEAGA